MAGYHSVALEPPDRASWARRKGKEEDERRLPETSYSVQISIITDEYPGCGESSKKNFFGDRFRKHKYSDFSNFARLLIKHLQSGRQGCENLSG